MALEDQGGSVGGDGDAGLFRVATCVVHISGALLLDCRDGDHYDAQLRWQLAGPPGHVPVVVRASSLGDLTAGAARQPSTEPEVTPWQHAQEVEDAGADMADGWAAAGGGSDDEDNGGGGAGGEEGDRPDEVMAGADGTGATSTGMGAETTDRDLAGLEAPGPPGTTQAGAAGAATPGRAMRSQHAAQGGATPAPLKQRGGGADGVEDDGPEPYDPYLPLDLDAPGSLVIRPMLVRRPPKGAVKSRHAVPTEPKSGVAAAAAGGLVHSEFGYALAALSLLLPGGSSKSARLPRGVAAAARGPETAAVFDLQDALAATATDPAAWQDDDHNGGTQNSDDDGAQPGVPDDGWGDDGGPPAYGSGAGMDELLSAMRQGAAARTQLDGGQDGDTEMGGGEAQSYEELCRAHMERMMAAAAAQVGGGLMHERGWTHTHTYTYTPAHMVLVKHDNVLAIQDHVNPAMVQCRI